MMFRKTAFTGKYIQDEGLLNELPQLVSLLDRSCPILTSRTGMDTLPSTHSRTQARTAELVKKA